MSLAVELLEADVIGVGLLTLGHSVIRSQSIEQKSEPKSDTEEERELYHISHHFLVHNILSHF